MADKDLIDRAEAIRAIVDKEDGEPNYQLEEVKKAIRALPSASNESDWKKYPEEKPEEMHNVLTSQLRPNGEIILAISSMHRGKWWIEDQSFGDDTKVIAFRELPAPFKEPK